MTVVDAPPATKHVLGSNHARVFVRHDQRTGRILAIGVIDNLVKGAAGQAIQAFNLVHGLPETAGLEQLPLRPVAPGPVTTIASTRCPSSRRCRSELPAVERRGRDPVGLPSPRAASPGSRRRAGRTSRSSPPSPARRRAGAGRRGRGLHPERVRGRARPAVAGAPRRRPSRPATAATAGRPAIVSTSGCANAATGRRRRRRPGRDRRRSSPHALGIAGDADAPALDRDHRHAAAARHGRGRDRRDRAAPRRDRRRRSRRPRRRSGRPTRGRRPRRRRSPCPIPTA